MSRFNKHQGCYIYFRLETKKVTHTAKGYFDSIIVPNSLLPSFYLSRGGMIPVTHVFTYSLHVYVSINDILMCLKFT